MSKSVKWSLIAAAIIIGLVLLMLPKMIRDYNTIQGLDEQIITHWSDVASQYQRRYDLIPNLTNIIKGYTNQEKDVLLEVAKARADVGKIYITTSQLTDLSLLQSFQACQDNLTAALSKLLIASGHYPELESLPLFHNFILQLKDTENRITITRDKYMEIVQQYNTLVQAFPNSIIASFMGYKSKANFSEKAPTLN